jgi:hypothetical protein
MTSKYGAVILERDSLRAEIARRDELRAYDARAVAPTPAERKAHGNGPWLVTWRTASGGLACEVRQKPSPRVAMVACIPIGPDGLPCLWPVVAGVTP